MTGFVVVRHPDVAVLAPAVDEPEVALGYANVFWYRGGREARVNRNLNSYRGTGDGNLPRYARM